MTKPLPRYKNCKYSLFATSDNTNKWVTHLHEAIETYLEVELKSSNIEPKQIFFTDKVSLGSGLLDDELKQAIINSFATLVVVGKHYAESAYCGIELKEFWDSFGKKGLSSRLSIVAMTPDDLKKANEKENWQEIIKNNQIWKKFYYQDGNKRNQKFKTKSELEETLQIIFRVLGS